MAVVNKALIQSMVSNIDFAAVMQEKAIELNAFISSGVAVNNPLITALANSSGSVDELPFFHGLANPQADGTNEPNYSTDDPTVKSTPNAITSGKQIMRKAFMNNSWSVMDLAAELSLQDPIGAILNRIAKYWAVNSEQRTLASALGVLADNVANDNGDMLFSVATDDAATPGPDEKISSDAVIAAKATMGDHAESLTAIAMHSVVFSELQRQEVIIYERAADTNINFPTYLGYRVIVDDSMPAVQGTNRITYTSILFGTGVFAQAYGMPEVPFEFFRTPDAGNGGGQDTLYSRTTEIIHPAGFAFLSAALAGESATFAELQDATNWNRVYNERKNVPMAFLQTNG